MDLPDEQWDVLAPLLPAPRLRRDGRGRPWRDPRAVLNGILWILRTGAPWKDLPERYPSYQTCHRRFQAWASSGTLDAVLLALARDLEARGGLDRSECCIDGPCSTRLPPGKRGRPHRVHHEGQGDHEHGHGRGPADRTGLPLAVRIASAAPHAGRRVEHTLDVLVPRAPVQRLIGDRAYDSDRLDARLTRRGITLSAPHRNGRRHATPDGRSLRRYRRRWKIERLLAWLQNYRRIVTRDERHADNCLGFIA